MTHTREQGERLQEARKRLGLGQIEFASQLGIPQSNLSPWEKGKRPIPRTLLLAVSKVFRIRYSWLEEGLGPFSEEEEYLEAPPEGIYSESSAVRLFLLREALELTRGQLAQQLGLAKGEIDLMEDGAKPIPLSVALALEHLYSANHQWLLGGGEWMWVKDESEEQSDWTPPRPAFQEKNFNLIPMIEGAATCGPGGEIQDPGPTALRYPFDPRFIQELLQECGSGTISDLFLLQCYGDSMRPTIYPEDQVLINASIPLRLEPRPGGLYLVRMDPFSGDARVKRFRNHIDGRLGLTSDAPGFAPIEIGYDGVPIHQFVLGRVCWISRSVMKIEQSDRNW